MSLSVVEVEIAGARYAVPLADVLEVVPRVWTTPLAAGGDDVEGLFLHRGRPAVAVAARPRLGHPSRRTLADHFVVLRTESPRLAMVVDAVLGTRVLDDAALEPPPVKHERFAGVAVTKDGMMLVVAAGELLSAEERAAVARAVESAP